MTLIDKIFGIGEVLKSADLNKLVNKINELVQGKVDSVDGKGLSTNDLTDELVEKINFSKTVIATFDVVDGFLVMDELDDKNAHFGLTDDGFLTFEN